MLVLHFLCVSGSTLKGTMPITVCFQKDKVITNEKLLNFFFLKIFECKALHVHSSPEVLGRIFLPQICQLLKKNIKCWKCSLLCLFILLNFTMKQLWFANSTWFLLFLSCLNLWDLSERLLLTLSLFILLSLT